MRPLATELASCRVAVCCSRRSLKHTLFVGTDFPYKKRYAEKDHYHQKNGRKGLNATMRNISGEHRNEAKAGRYHPQKPRGITLRKAFL
jgi:hypothetical protein